MAAEAYRRAAGLWRLAARAWLRRAGPPLRLRLVRVTRIAAGNAEERPLHPFGERRREGVAANGAAVDPAQSRDYPRGNVDGDESRPVFAGEQPLNLGGALGHE